MLRQKSTFNLILYLTYRLATTLGKMIIRNNGVVREVIGLGLKPLPKIFKKAGERHFQGSHFVILFDSSSAVQREILRSLKNDPRVIRSFLTKVDDSKNYNAGSSVTRAIKAIKEHGYEKSIPL
ncbi:hypothetical protein KL918_001666 [Ogataea parapolymorpha]|nr:hypothetical protein KL918_001666 [Ogataea parapolymorpha]KAG7874104.1 hypothetical protein KL916_001878 [Ogataea parapolymorpha]KAG7885516.1 hypothetical protein KL938_000548 [Ogataea parapolymorpha]